jgi:hypothetical protein
MRSFIFVFLGVVESDSNVSINILQKQLKKTFEKNIQQPQILPFAPSLLCVIFPVFSVNKTTPIILIKFTYPLDYTYYISRVKMNAWVYLL